MSKDNKQHQNESYLARCRRVIAQQVGQLAAVSGVLVNAKLDVLAKVLVKLVKVLFVLGDLVEQLDALFNQVLANNYCLLDGVNI
jgi:hypothetical protein